jgi:hypothetical protein
MFRIGGTAHAQRTKQWAARFGSEVLFADVAARPERTSQPPHSSTILKLGDRLPDKIMRDQAVRIMIRFTSLGP